MCFIKKEQLKHWEIIRKNNEDPAKAITLAPQTLKPINHGKLRVGRPRGRWVPITIKQYRDEVVNNNIPSVIKPPLDLNNEIHVQRIRNAAFTGMENRVSIR